MTTPQSNPSTTPKRSRLRKLLKRLATLLFVAFLLLNAIAFMQARAMTHFVPAGSRTPPPEQLTLAGKIKILLTGVRPPRPENLINPSAVNLDFQTVRFGGAANDDCEGWLISVDRPKALCILFNSYSA